MTNTKRRELMAQRDAALKAGDVAAFQRLTVEISKLPLAGVRELTLKDIEKYVSK